MIQTCAFCKTTLPSAPEAIDAGWIPTYTDGDGVEYHGPVCVGCMDKHLIYSIQYADYQLPAGHPLPAAARRLDDKGPMSAEDAMAEIWGLVCPDCGPTDYAGIVAAIKTLAAPTVVVVKQE